MKSHDMRRYAMLIVLLATGCTPLAGTHLDAQSVVHAPRTWPTAPQASPDASPRIVRVWMNETHLLPGSTWRGRIVTTTNVASLELRTESFSFNATRTSFGTFSFSQQLLDLVPQYKRPYTLQIIARNTPGDRAIDLVPISFQ